VKVVINDNDGDDDEPVTERWD